ncbi:MAG: hypothetical protein A4E29_01042 [Methanomassiliicoccales archaeon PtaB.Bin134]|nr:MAG: hypothetical protein A4E29_01042 [Methanomassiliicoccales archaeon PtaB.Bin134]
MCRWSVTSWRSLSPLLAFSAYFLVHSSLNLWHSISRLALTIRALFRTSWVASLVRRVSFLLARSRRWSRSLMAVTFSRKTATCSLSKDEAHIW